MLIYNAVLIYSKYSRLIPLKELLEQEKIIRLNKLKQNEANDFREKECKRFIKLMDNLTENCISKVIDSSKVLANLKDDEVIEDYLNLHMIAKIMGEDKITVKHRKNLQYYALELDHRNLGLKVGYTYQVY